MIDIETDRPRPRKGELKRWGPAGLALLVVAFYYLATRPGPAPEGWLTEFGPATAQAAATNRCMLVQFTLPGCPACVTMKRTVLNKSQVIDALREFVPVHIDASKESELATRFGVYVTPSYAVVDPDGRLLAKAEGYVPVDEFVAFLNRAAALTVRPEVALPPPSAPTDDGSPSAP